MLNGVTMKINIDEYLLNTLKEDITSEDVSTNAVMPEDKQGKADLICKQDGVICGLDVFERTYKLLDETSRFESNFKDGDLQRMSGIATITREYMDELKGYKTVLLDTRKTTPNMRPFEKHAVKVGGATNHRYNLSDGVLLKDNHIGAAGSVTKAIEMARAYAPFVRKIEIETETLDQVQEAIDAGADIIMLDNMDNETMRKAVAMIDGRAQTECSGNVTKSRLKEIAEIGVDFVSCGALTHSAPIMDISLKNLTPIE